MRTLKCLLVIGLIGTLVGCAGNIVVKMPKTTDAAHTELLADVKVIDLRQPGVASSKREAAFGVPMGTVEFDPPASQLIKQELETELTKLLTEKGIESKRYYVTDIVEFGINTDTTPLYWDVIGRIHLLVKAGGSQHDLFGTHTIRTYVWPGEEIIQKVISESLKQIISGLKPVSAGGMDKPFADKSASAASKLTADMKVAQPRSFAVATEQKSTIDPVTKTQDLVSAYGYWLGQRYRLEQLRITHPKLINEINTAEGVFLDAYRPAIEAIKSTINKNSYDGALQEIEKQFLTKFQNDKQLQEHCRNTDHDCAIAIIKETKQRAKGEMDQQTLVTLLRFHPDYNETPYEEYKRGYHYRYESDGSGKAKGIRFHIDIPTSYVEVDDSKLPPNALKMFARIVDPTYTTLTIFIFDAESFSISNEREWYAIVVQAMASLYKPFLLEGEKVLDGGGCKVGGKFGGVFVAFSKDFREGEKNITNEYVSYMTFYSGKVITIRGETKVKIDDRKIEGARIHKYMPLFWYLAEDTMAFID